MIYPILLLNQEETAIQYIDTAFDENPFLEVTFAQSQDDAVEAWLNMLTAFATQYFNGYDMGYTDALGDVEDDDNENYGDIQWM